MRVGVFGGSFDPVHYGHLRAAEWAREEYALDEVRLVPAKRSPFKSDAAAPAEDRFRMIEIATQEALGLVPSRAEIDREPPSYSIETLRAFKKEIPAAEIFLLVGSDAAASLDSWREASEIRKLATVCALKRPGDSSAQGNSSFPGIQVSSSEIRDLVRNGRSIRFLVHEGVRRYIDARGLYR